VWHDNKFVKLGDARDFVTVFKEIFLFFCTADDSYIELGVQDELRTMVRVVALFLFI